MTNMVDTYKVLEDGTFEDLKVSEGVKFGKYRIHACPDCGSLEQPYARRANDGYLKLWCGTCGWHTQFNEKVSDAVEEWNSAGEANE